MTPFTTLTGAAAVLPMDNIDTDVIIRIERLTSLPRDQLGPYAFESIRLRTDGSEDPNFILNRPPFRDAPILLTGSNFGCGSSREGAVWSLLARGIRCVIGDSFGDIFHSNCFQNGLLAIRLPAEVVASISAQTLSGAALTVDLTTQGIRLPDGQTVAFDVDAMRRASLLEGLDDIGRSLRFAPAIATWQAQDRQRRPWAWLDRSTSSTSATEDPHAQ